jgi:hypothetical protein
VFAPPTQEEVDNVLLAMKRIQNLRPGSVSSRHILAALLFPDFVSGLTEVDAQIVRGFVLTIRVCSLAAIDAAIWARMAPTNGLTELEMAESTHWAMAKELHFGRSFLERTQLVLQSDGNDAATTRVLQHLRALADPTKVCSRRDWERAFGVSLPRKSRWRAFDAPNRSVALRRRVREEENGYVSPGPTSMRELLTLAQPSDIIGSGWGSPLAYFCQGMLHFGEVLTEEGVEALARYIARRHAELRSKRPVIEVGAGLGRLSHLLNTTGSLAHLPEGRIIASDPHPDDQCEPHGYLFEVEPLDARQALERWQPDLVVCAWMDFGRDWCADFRRAGVREYLLIGELGLRSASPIKSHERLAPDGRRRTMTPEEQSAIAGSCRYSLSLPVTEHTPYERVLLEDVSAELLHIHDAQDAEEGCSSDPGSLAAVAFRRG